MSQYRLLRGALSVETLGKKTGLERARGCGGNIDMILACGRGGRLFQVKEPATAKAQH